MTMTGSEVAKTSTEEEEEGEIMDSRDQALEVIISNPAVVVDIVTTGGVKMTEDQGQDMMDREEVALTTTIGEMTTEEETTEMIKEETMGIVILHMATATIPMAMAMPGLVGSQTLASEEETILTMLVLAWTMIGLVVESLAGTMEGEVLASNSDLLDCNLEQRCLLCSLLVLRCRSNSSEEVLEVPEVQDLTGTTPTDPTIL